MSPSELSTHLSSAPLPVAARLFHALLARIDAGSLQFTAPDGSISRFHGWHPGPTADLALHDWDVAARILRTAEIGLAEGVRDGRAETSDLTALLRLCVANEQALAQYFYARPLAAAVLRLKHLCRTNTRAQARRNIQAHYDLSNEFYALWLDPTMTYSSGIGVPDGDCSADALASAQVAKYERILDELAPAPGDHVLEIGCGWGGFALHAARTRDVRITGLTLSPAQLRWAREQVAAAGLSDRIDLRLVDYRDLTGRFDHVVSIEMFESVGERYWQTYFDAISAHLRPGGRAVLQAITIDERVFPRYRRSSDFIREFIFPGGMLAPVSRMVRDAARAGLAAGTPYRFGLDYARTLRAWHQRFQAAASAVDALGFDARFRRLWQFYLNYCEAGFRSGRTDVVQLTLRHA